MGYPETYSKWYGEILSEDNRKQLYIPPGFAHGLLMLSDEAEFQYKYTEFYHREDESDIIWNDSDISIDSPLNGIDETILSDKDRKWRNFKDSKIMY